MFYVQLMNGDYKVQVEITDENVYTDCPVCGKPRQVDITEIDCLYSTEIYCTECFEKQKGENHATTTRPIKLNTV